MQQKTSRTKSMKSGRGRLLNLLYLPTFQKIVHGLYVVQGIQVPAELFMTSFASLLHATCAERSRSEL